MTKQPKPFGKWFQIRWREPLGKPQCPYLYRWTLIVLGFSIRLHHWLRSDDRRFYHDHACNFISIVLKGKYENVTPAGRREDLDIPKGGAWTLLICGRPYQKWGFYVKGRKMRPLKYFHKYGVIQDENYQ